MNAISTLEELLGLSQRNTSAGSFLQLKEHVRFQHEDDADTSWPDSSFWIVGRELLLFLQLDVRSIPANQRTKVIDRKVEQASPFPRTGHFAHDVDGRVMLWLWDEELRQVALQKTIEDYSALRDHVLNLSVVPETVLQSPGSNGSALVGCSTGSDIQQWSDGILESSRWTAEVSEVSTDFLGMPWSVNTGGVLFLREALMWRGGLLLLCLVAMFQLGAVVGSVFINNSLTSQLSDAREQVAAAAQVRGQVSRVQQQNQQLLEWAALPGQLGLLAEFDHLLPESAKFLDWDYQDNQLRVVIEDDELNNRVYLESLAASDRFVDVRVSPGTNQGSAVITLEVGAR